MKYLTFLCVLCLIVSPSPVLGDPLGDTLRAKGQTEKQFQQETVFLNDGDPLFERERVLTGENSRLEVRFEDGTMLYLGDHSDLVISKWLYQPDGPGSALFNLSQGVFRMVSGAINTAQNSTFLVRTPIATIGVRGTDFWGHQTKDSLLMALLDDGRLDIVAQGQTISLTEPLSAVMIKKGPPPGDIFTLSADQLAAAVQTVR